MGTFSGQIGFFRILTIVFGILDLALAVAADSLFSSYPLEQIFIVIVIICLVISCLIMLGYLLSASKTGRASKLDVIFHVLAGIVLFFGGVCMLSSVVRFGRSHGQISVLLRILSGSLGITNSVVYIIVTLSLYRSS